MSDNANLIRVRLHDRGEDAETAWAADLGPVPDVPGGRRVRLENVPFLHAKPTYGDEFIVAPDEDGMLAWDLGGVSWHEIPARLAHDAGRYALIVDYSEPSSGSVQASFDVLCAAARALDMIPEGCYGPRDGEPGRLYLAAPESVKPEAVINHLVACGAMGAVTLIHPVDDAEEGG